MEHQLIRWNARNAETTDTTDVSPRMDTNERREHRSHGYSRLTQILGKDGSRKTEDRRPKWNADPPAGGEAISFERLLLQTSKNEVFIAMKAEDAS